MRAVVGVSKSCLLCIRERRNTRGGWCGHHRPQEENGCGEASEMDERSFLMSLMPVAVGKAIVDVLMVYAHQAMPLGVGKRMQQVWWGSGYYRRRNEAAMVRSMVIRSELTISM